MIYNFENKSVKREGKNWIAPNATIIGDVVLKNVRFSEHKSIFSKNKSLCHNFRIFKNVLKIMFQNGFRHNSTHKHREITLSWENSKFLWG